MPHIVTFDGLSATQAGFQEPDDFLKLGDIKGAFQADELTGKFDAVSGARDFSGDISGIAWGDPDRQQLEGQAFLREQRSAVRGDGDNEGWNCTCVPDSLFTEIFETAPGMNSFAGSLNPAPGLGGTAGPGATSFMTGQFDMPTDNVGNPYSAPID